MERDGQEKIKTPWWIWGIMVALALIEPLMHGWIWTAPPAGHVPTQLHTVDTYAYMSGMRYFKDDYYSPYATVDSPVGDRDPSLYALPHHRMYGWLGILTGWVPLPQFYCAGAGPRIGAVLDALDGVVPVEGECTVPGEEGIYPVCIGGWPGGGVVPGQFRAWAGTSPKSLQGGFNGFLFTSYVRGPGFSRTCF